MSQDIVGILSQDSCAYACSKQADIILALCSTDRAVIKCCMVRQWRRTLEFLACPWMLAAVARCYFDPQISAALAACLMRACSCAHAAPQDHAAGAAADGAEPVWVSNTMQGFSSNVITLYEMLGGQ